MVDRVTKPASVYPLTVYPSVVDEKLKNAQAIRVSRIVIVFSTVL